MELAFPIDYGLPVEYAADKYIVFYQEGVEYPIGGMMCELARLHPSEIKDVIMNCPFFELEANIENLGEAFVWLETALIQTFGVVTGKVLTAEFMEFTFDILRNQDNQEYMDKIESDKESSINKYIFEGTGFSGAGMDNVGHIFLTVYTQQAISFVVFEHLFVGMMESCTGHEAGDDVEVKVIGLFGELLGAQHIDYRILCMDTGLASVYTIKTCVSLLAFEVANCLEKNVMFSKCKNCDNYFVLTGRADAVYCSYAAPNAKGKTCKEIGAQVTRANKEKNDITTSEYRKIYMRLKMHSNRHKKEIKIRMQLEKLVTEGKEWRRKLSLGAVTSDEFLEWLKEYQ